MHKETFLRKLMADDLVELKSIRECKAQNLLPKDIEELFKDNTTYISLYGINILPEMAECFGKVLYVHQQNTGFLLKDGDSTRVALMTPDNRTFWYWPLEMVKR